MSNISVIFGSTTGNTEAAAQQIAAALGGSAVNVNDATADDFAADLVVLGTSTWGVGDLQDDWAAQLSKLQAADLSGRKVALFGEGDQTGFGDSFVSGMGALAEEAEKKGATLAHGVRRAARRPVRRPRARRDERSRQDGRPHRRLDGAGQGRGGRLAPLPHPFRW